jgi:hypothetical protein
MYLCTSLKVLPFKVFPTFPKSITPPTFVLLSQLKKAKNNLVSLIKLINSKYLELNLVAKMVEFMEESVDEASEASEYESDSENEEVRIVLNFTNIF